VDILVEELVVPMKGIVAYHYGGYTFGTMTLASASKDRVGVTYDSWDFDKHAHHLPIMRVGPARY
jgi:hypothetical protein